MGYAGRIKSVPGGVVAALCCCTVLAVLLCPFRPSRVTGVRDTGGGVTAHALDEEVTPVIGYVVGGLEPSLASSG